MSTRSVAVGVIALGSVFLASACAVSVEEPLPEDEHVDTRVEQISPPRLIRPNPIDPGRRVLSCLPDPRKTYVARDPEACETIRFYCPEGSAPFFDSCGCGCEIVRRP
jgi:hypothetical protein